MSVSVLRHTLRKKQFPCEKRNEENDIYCDFISQYSNNKKITCYVRCNTGSEDGKDAKSVEELKALISSVKVIFFVKKMTKSIYLKVEKLIYLKI